MGRKSKQIQELENKVMKLRMEVKLLRACPVQEQVQLAREVDRETTKTKIGIINKAIKEGNVVVRKRSSYITR